MPVAQFQDANGNRYTRSVHNPMRMDDAKYWLKEARQSIPEIPDPRKTDWVVSSFDATLDWVMIDMINPIQERCRLVIARNRDTMVPSHQTRKTGT